MVSYENGKIPPSLLKRVSNFRPLYANVNSNVGSDLLREDAWAALNVLQFEFFKRFERSLNVSEAYRGLNRQTAVWQQYINGDGPLAARPGTSNHGWGISSDFGSDVDIYGSATKYWMDRNAPRWGWHPVGNGFAKPEAWHFEFKPGTATETIPASSGATPFPTNPTIPEYEDDMPLNDTDKLWLQQNINDVVVKAIDEILGTRVNELAAVLKNRNGGVVIQFDDSATTNQRGTRFVGAGVETVVPAARLAIIRSRNLLPVIECTSAGEFDQIRALYVEGNATQSSGTVAAIKTLLGK